MHYLLKLAATVPLSSVPHHATPPCLPQLAPGSPSAELLLNSRGEKRRCLVVELAEAWVNAQARGGRQEERRAGGSWQISWHRLPLSCCWRERQKTQILSWSPWKDVEFRTLLYFCVARSVTPQNLPKVIVKYLVLSWFSRQCYYY